MTTTLDAYKLQNAAASQATTEERIYSVSGDIGRHERRLDEQDGNIKGLLSAVSGLQIGVRWLTWSVAGLFGIFVLGFLFSMATMVVIVVIFAPVIGKLF